ncbi:MAG: ATP-binding protein, partial [Candidatus Velthaea sp.]
VADAVFRERAPLGDAALLALELTPALERLDLQLPAVPASAPLARAALRRFVHGLALPAGRAFDVVLAAGEAVANAIEHAYVDTAGPSRFTLRANRRKRRFQLTVEDYGKWRSGERTLERGRGLELMYALADDFAIEETARGTRVRMVFALELSRART